MKLRDFFDSDEEYEQAKIEAQEEFERTKPQVERRCRARTKSDRKYRHVDAESKFKSYQAWQGNYRRFAEAYRRKNPRLSKHLSYNLVWFW